MQSKKYPYLSLFLSIGLLPQAALAQVGGASSPAQILSNIYQNIIQPCGLGVAVFGLVAAVFVFFTRGALSAVYTGVGGLIVGAVLYNAESIARLVTAIGT